jgi:hypothetical protein
MIDVYQADSYLNSQWMRVFPRVPVHLSGTVSYASRTIERITSLTLPFAVQDDVLWNQGLTCQQHLDKAILRFQLLIRDFNLPHLLHLDSLTTKLQDGSMKAVIILNNTGSYGFWIDKLFWWMCVCWSQRMALFVHTGLVPSRIFWMVHQSWHGGDRLVRVLHIITWTAVTVEMMLELSFQFGHCERDSLVAMLKGPGNAVLSGNQLYWSFIPSSSLHFDRCDIFRTCDHTWLIRTWQPSSIKTCTIEMPSHIILILPIVLHGMELWPELNATPNQTEIST